MFNLDNMITIIVPVYKIEEEYLRRCIESLIDQQRNDYRVILVDDGSPDQCGYICDEYAQQSEVISVIHQENQGLSGARNTGIKETQTKWLTFVDADDWIDSKYISNLYRFINADAKDADIILFDYFNEYKKNSRSPEKLNIKKGFLNLEDLTAVQLAPFYKFIQNKTINSYEIAVAWNKVYKTDFLKGNNLWFIPEARKGQDRLFNANALNSTEKVFYLDITLYHYRCLSESVTNRYNDNIITLTDLEISELQNQIEKHNLGSLAKDYLNCRTCTRLYSCMRLYLFNEENHDQYSERIKKVKKLINAEPYRSALQKVNMRLLSWDERMFVVCLKAGFFRMLYMMVKIKSKITERKLA